MTRVHNYTNNKQLTKLSLTKNRHFQPLHIVDSSVVDTINILKGIKEEHESHHGVVKGKCRH